MIDINEIININYNYDNIQLVSPFNLRYERMDFDKSFILKFNIDYYEAMIYEVSFDFFMTFTEYITFLDKLYNTKSKASCNLCKSISKLFCGYCYKFFCEGCFGIHSLNCDFYAKLILKFKKLGMDYKKYIYRLYEIQTKKNRKSKNSIENIPNIWKICSCGNKEIKTFCHHGLKCDNCYCYSCDNDFMAENFRFFQLDIIFLKSQSEHYDEIKSIEKEVNLFNEKVVKLFLEYEEIIEKLENESRKKRILRHFNKLRNDFIAYQKLKLIIC